VSIENASAKPNRDFDVVIKTTIRALRALGEAGRPDQASRIAARSWSQLRHSDPRTAERLNGTLHYLAELPGHAITPPTPRGPEGGSDAS